MSRFWKLVLLRVTVSWLSPSSVLLCSLAFMAWKLWPSVNAAVTTLTASCAKGQPCGILTKANEGIDTILAESRNVTVALVDKGRPGKPETMGLIPSVQAVARDTGAAVRGISTQVTENGQIAAGAVQSLNIVSTKLGGTADALTGEINSLKATTDTLPPLVGDVRIDLQHLQPVEDNASQSFADFDALLKSKDLVDAIHGTSQTAENFGKISGDLYVWSHPILNPDPCKTKKCVVARTFKDIEGLAGFGANAYQFSNLFRPLSVSLQK